MFLAFLAIAAAIMIDVYLMLLRQFRGLCGGLVTMNVPQPSRRRAPTINHDIRTRPNRV